MNVRNVGIGRINFDELARLLQLPDGQRIESAYCPSDIYGIEVRIAGDGMPVVQEGGRIPHVPLVIKD